MQQTPIPNPPPNPDAPPSQPPKRETTPIPLPTVGLGKDQLDVVSRLMKDSKLSSILCANGGICLCMTTTCTS